MASVRASDLWRSLTPERRMEAALAFWADEQSVAEQGEVVGLIGRQINFRSRSVLTLPVERRAQYLARMNRLSEAVAGRLLVAYHLAAQRPMLAAFLDALGIEHDRGLITADELKVPGRDALLAAARQLAAFHPPGDVALYFSTLLVQDESAWGPLREALPAAPDASASR